MTEDETVERLMTHLKTQGWDIESYCLGQTRGYDIVATKKKQRMYVEVKGARASDKSPTKKRAYFDSGQLRSHMGRAIIKTLETKHANPNAKIAIAHPEHPYLRTTLGHIIEEVKKMGVIHFWVREDGKVTLK